MKNKRIFNFMAMLGLVAVLASCGSSGSITKRYHSRGYQISFDWLKKSPTATPAQALMPAPAKARPAMAIQAEQLGSKTLSVQAPTGVPEPPKPCKAEIKAELAKAKSAIKASAADAKTAVQAGIAAAGPAIAGIRPALQEVKPELKKATDKAEAIAQKVHKNDDNQLIAAIVAIFIPFIGVLIYEGSITSHFWISLLLTLLLYVPGLVYSLLVIFDVIS
jgi:uncharacterized membrane protein YqaE (UPF0057 family)